uniref:Uncharacterized protein n=1 Tax=Coccolithus braarudii TaxID=221442 RepID=A0A7S0L2J0_9EUKA
MVAMIGSFCLFSLAPTPTPDMLTAADETYLQLLPQKSCPEMAAAIDKYGFRVVAEYITNKQTHAFAQIVAQNELKARSDDTLTDMRDLARLALSGFPKHGGFAYGYLHGAVWYDTGVAKTINWTRIEKDLCSIPTYEFLSVCLHGIGHAGFIRILPDEYEGCSSVPSIDATRLHEAYQVCSKAPSTFLEMSCANGFYHGIAEELNPIEEKVHWMYPCNSDEFAFPEMCWKWMFFQIPLMQLPGHPFRGFESRVVGFEQSGKFDICTTNGFSERIVLACIFGMSGVVFTGFWGEPRGQFALAWNFYYNSLASDSLIYSETPLVDWCLHFLEEPPLPDSPQRALSQVDARRWLTCVSGSLEFIMSQLWRTTKVPMETRLLVCEQLREVSWQTDTMRHASYDLCVARAHMGYLSYIPTVGPTDVVDRYGVWTSSWETSNWDVWRTASVDEQWLAMWPIYNFSYAAVEEVSPTAA